MPFISRDYIVLFFLLTCVPLQHLLVSKFSTSSEYRSTKLNNIFREVHMYAHTLLSPRYWIKETIQHLKSFFKTDYSNWYISDNNSQGECPAVEVIQYTNPTGNFATSPKPRVRRSTRIKWRIGQVVRHTEWGYKAVIIGWDEYCKAPESWITRTHGSNLHWRSQPNYALLVDEGDMDAIITYEPQENIAPIKETVKNGEITKYFDYYDGAQYIPQPWLNAIYPLD